MDLCEVRLAEGETTLVISRQSINKVKSKHTDLRQGKSEHGISDGWSEQILNVKFRLINSNNLVNMSRIW